MEAHLVDGALAVADPVLRIGIGLVFDELEGAFVDGGVGAGRVDEPVDLPGVGVGDLVDATAVVTDLRVETVR